MTETNLAAIEARMGSGEPFTYSGLCTIAGNRDEGRLADKAIQKWRRKGWIKMDGRIGRAPRWVIIPGART